MFYYVMSESTVLLKSVVTFPSVISRPPPSVTDCWCRYDSKPVNANTEAPSPRRSVGLLTAHQTRRLHNQQSNMRSDERCPAGNHHHQTSTCSLSGVYFWLEVGGDAGLLET